MQLPPAQRERAVLVDTSAFYACLDRDDQWHAEATRGLHLLAQERRPLFTTNLVVAETYTLLRLRLGHPIAQRWLESLAAINLVFQRQEHHRAVQTLLARYQKHTFSYTDALSFVMMEEMDLQLAFAFDRHFQQYGWQLFPAPLSQGA
ncbi:MAG: type II toxin-antitoxin system VapC family toxin [Chloroflexi bacterium]|nr:type II toxin-antitoxin system VapC family toxin [Chloroflexota bacterium]